MADLSLFMTGGGKLRYQDFTTSGTFTPSAKLVANGGACFVILIGGGGGGSVLNSSAYNGKHGQYISQHTKITSPIAVTIGAGGAGNSGGDGAVGGATSVGSLTATGGINGGGSYTLPNGNYVWSINGPRTSDDIDAYLPPNVGRGGLYGVAGTSGFARIIWSE
jgi:hypothetical protein